GQELKFQDQQSQYPHKFYDRATFFETIIPDIARNYDRRGKMENKSHTTFLVPGGSGVGNHAQDMIYN
ncbi:hypothetical protein BGZ65_000967, partial [Modicella reniformis]